MVFIFLIYFRKTNIFLEQYLLLAVGDQHQLLSGLERKLDKRKWVDG